MAVIQITLHHYICMCVVVKRDIQESDEEAVRVKEQSILELGGLLAKTGQAAGNRTWCSYLMWEHTCNLMSCCLNGVFYSFSTTGFKPSSHHINPDSMFKLLTSGVFVFAHSPTKDSCIRCSIWLCWQTANKNVMLTVHLSWPPCWMDKVPLFCMEHIYMKEDTGTKFQSLIINMYIRSGRRCLGCWICSQIL